MKLGIVGALLTTGFAFSALATSSKPVPANPTSSAGGGDGAGDSPIIPDTATDTEVTPAAKPGFSAWVDLDNSLGSGAFVSNSYVNNPALSTNLYLKPAYKFQAWGQSLALTLWENLYYADILDKTALDQRQIDWSDLRITLSDAKIYEEPHTHLQLGGMIRAVAPISYASRYNSLITTIWAGVVVSRSLYGLDLKAGLLAGKEFHRYTTAQIPCSDITSEPVNVAPGEAPNGGFLNALADGNCQPGSTLSGNGTTPPNFVDNISWDVVPYFDAQYNFSDKWNVGVTIYYFDQFAYPMPVDQYSTQVTDSSGNPVAQSQGRSDSLWTIASVGYSITEHWQLGAGLWDTSLPKTTDNRSFLPWFIDPYGLATNDWTAYFDVIATF
jgi:hypothetical protein